MTRLARNDLEVSVKEKLPVCPPPPGVRKMEHPAANQAGEMGVESMRFSILKMEIAIKRSWEWRSKVRAQLDGFPKGVGS